MKKIKIFCLMALTAVLAFSFVGCNINTSNDDEIVTEHEINIPSATKVSEDYTAYPRAEGETQQTIDYIDITGCSWNDLMLSVMLQGIVNRQNPSVYLVHEYVVQGYANFNAPQFWLDALDESYFESDGVTPYYKKNRIPSLNRLVLKYYDKFDGAVLYHERILNQHMFDQNTNANIYGDMAILNLTSMMCAQFNALPLTESGLDALNTFLSANGKSPLAVVADSREFMQKDSNGNFTSGVESTGSREVWYNVYRYALDQIKNGEWEVSDRALAHNGTFNAACYDYSTAHKMFTYNRILANHRTDAERDLELEIFRLTKDNTPVIGVWHLSGDEESLVMGCNDNGKFFLVTHESWNLSWSSGMPRVQGKEKTEKLTYDDTKVYIAFTFSETDNNSYTQMRFPQEYDVPARGEFAVSWGLNQACVDINPNVIQYMNLTMTEKDGFATGESGIGYIRNPSVLPEYKADFYGLSDLYAKRLGNGNMRTLLNDTIAAMDYAMYMDNVDSILSGYGAGGIAGTNEFNSGAANFYFHDTPIFQTFSAVTAPETLLNVKADGGSFFSYGLAGWETNIENVFKVFRQLPDNYQVVTQSQLADLYRQKMELIFNNVTEADFSTGMNENETGFLYYSDDFTNYQKAFLDGQEEYRFGRNTNELVYRFRLGEDVESANFVMQMSGEYIVQASTDLKNWTQTARYDIADGDTEYQTKRAVSFSLPSDMAGKTVYIRLSDPTPQDGVGYQLYHINLVTDKTGTVKPIDIPGYADANYYISGGELTENNYRKGEVIYNLPLSSSVKNANIAVVSDGSVELFISLNGTNWYPVNTQLFDRGNFEGYSDIHTGYLDSVAPGLKLKIIAENEIEHVRITPVKTVSEFLFSPCGNETDINNAYSGWDANRTMQGLSSNARIGNTDMLSYAFRLDKDRKNPMLEVFAGGFFNLEISADGISWHTLKSVTPGENISEPIIFDVMAYVKADSVFFIRFKKSQLTGANASIYYLQLTSEAV